jgi:hypothetical protein
MVQGQKVQGHNVMVLNVAKQKPVKIELFKFYYKGALNSFL